MKKKIISILLIACMLIIPAAPAANAMYPLPPEYKIENSLLEQMKAEPDGVFKCLLFHTYAYRCYAPDEKPVLYNYDAQKSDEYVKIISECNEKFAALIDVTEVFYISGYGQYIGIKATAEQIYKLAENEAVWEVADCNFTPELGVVSVAELTENVKDADITKIANSLLARMEADSEVAWSCTLWLDEPAEWPAMGDRLRFSPESVKIIKEYNETIAEALDVSEVCRLSDYSADISVKATAQQILRLSANENVVRIRGVDYDHPENDIEIISGDVTGDGEVKAADARLVLRYSAELSELSDEQLAAADMSGDGEVDAKDARMILRISAGLNP